MWWHKIHACTKYSCFRKRGTIERKVRWIKHDQFTTIVVPFDSVTCKILVERNEWCRICVKDKSSTKPHGHTSAHSLSNSLFLSPDVSVVSLHRKMSSIHWIIIIVHPDKILYFIAIRASWIEFVRGFQAPQSVESNCEFLH